jgi:acetyl esterase/lipase
VRPAVFALLLAAGLRAEMTVARDVRYAETVGVAASAQSLDLYAPAGARGAPALVYVHGGSWSAGDKRAVGAKAEFFTASGWIFVSVNYRLLPEGRHPANVEDVARAIAWVHTNVVRYGGDPAKIVLMGHSAGAHLVALAATDARPLRQAGKTLEIVKGVIPLDTTAYDLPALMQTGAAFYGRIFGTDPKVWRDASPAHHVVRGKGIPPFLIFYTRGMGAGESNPIRSGHANAFANVLRQAGVPADAVDATDRTHTEINQWFGRKDDVTAKAMQFLNSLAGTAARTNGGAMHEWVKAYAALGEHRTATDVDLATAEWLAKTLREMGLHVEFQEFTVPQFQLRSARLTVGGRSHEAFPEWPPRATGQPVRGALTLAPEKDRIALIDLSAESRRPASLYRSLAAAGAAGIVAIDYSPEGLFHAENVMRPVPPPAVPVLKVGSRDRAALLESARRGEVAELEISGEFDAKAAARNVIATTGSGRRRIVVSTPYSGWFRCGGERGSGIAVWLALARWAAGRNNRVAFTFVANSGHELGYAGMRGFLDSRAPAKEDVIAWLHLGANVALLPDSRPTGGNRASRLFVSNPEWETALARFFDQTPWVRLFSRDRPAGELAFVLPKGYPGINLAGGGNRFMHSPGDGPETTGPAVLEPVASALIRMLHSFSESNSNSSKGR